MTRALFIITALALSKCGPSAVPDWTAPPLCPNAGPCTPSVGEVKMEVVADAGAGEPCDGAAGDASTEARPNGD